MPIGNRPKPRVARGAAPRFNKANTGRAPGVSNSKSPTGDRPVPRVAKNRQPTPTLPGATTQASHRFPMPKLNMRRLTGARRVNGGS